MIHSVPVYLPRTCQKSMLSASWDLLIYKLCTSVSPLIFVGMIPDGFQCVQMTQWHIWSGETENKKKRKNVLCHFSPLWHSWPNSPWIHKSETLGKINGRMCNTNQEHWFFTNITVTLRKYSVYCKVLTYYKSRLELALESRSPTNTERNKKRLHDFFLIFF